MLEPPGRPAGHGTAPVPAAAAALRAPTGRLPGHVRGREELAGQLRALASAPDGRAHVLAGLGGTGKTTLALELAEEASGPSRPALAPGAGPPADAAALAARLGGLPLALHHAGLALAADFAPECTFADYLAALQDRFGPAHGPRPRRRTGHRDQHLGTVPGHPRRPRLPPGPADPAGTVLPGPGRGHPVRPARPGHPVPRLPQSRRGPGR